MGSGASGLHFHEAESFESRGRQRGGIRPTLTSRAALGAKVVATAEGNPLFIEELVASIEDEEISEKLPSTIRAVIAARIDGLPADARSALLNASVIGKTFWRGVLGRIGDVKELGAALDALETRGLIQRRAASRVQDDVEFSFRHDLILDTAYTTLPRATRRELHAATAAALESLVRKPAEIAWILAHHWREGGDAQRARTYLLVAAERAADALAVEETYDFYTQALDLAADPSEQYHIRLLRGLALVQLEDFARAADELAELVPNLEGSNKVEALLGRTHATLWTEQADETMASAQEALRLASSGGFSELEPVALGLLGSAHGMRGDEGDVALAVELGEQALDTWLPNTRRAELAEHCHLMSNHYYWLGDYERAMNAAQLSATTAGVDLCSREFRLRGAGMRAIGLAGVRRYEEAISAAEDAIELATAMGRPMNVVLNYSTLPLREIFALDEALERSDAVAERLGPSDFNMPWMNARADAFTAHVMRGDVSLAQREWSSLWADTLTSKAWERWLVSGRLAAARADLELSIGQLDDAVTWGSRAIDMAVASSRRKYEAIARTRVGRSLIATHAYDQAATELRHAMALADALGSPLLRWQSRAALAQALASTAGDPDVVYDEAATIIRARAAGLTSHRAATYLGAPQVVDVLEATGLQGVPSLAPHQIRVNGVAPAVVATRPCAGLVHGPRSVHPMDEERFCIRPQEDPMTDALGRLRTDVTHGDVLRAIDEYDRLGPEQFFAVHGFGPSRTYELVWSDRRYPHKAVLGTAYELAKGQRLSSSDFEGGKSGAVAVLRKLGFTVEDKQ